MYNVLLPTYIRDLRDDDGGGWMDQRCPEYLLTSAEIRLRDLF